MDETKGFELILHDYCSNCPYFEADVTTLDTTTLENKDNQYIYKITCEKIAFCERIKARVERV